MNNNNHLRQIERPLREKNSSYKERKLCLQQLTLHCRVELERISVDTINKYCKREKTEGSFSSDFSTKKRIEDKRKLKYLLQNTSVLKNKSRLCSVWRRRLSELIRKNFYQVNMIKQRLRSSKVNMNCKEKNEKSQIIKCSNIKTNSIAAKLRKKQDDFAKLESAVFSDVLIKQKCGFLKTNTNKVNKRDTGQEQVNRKTVCGSIAENGEYADNKSSSGLKLTIKMPREGVLPNVVISVPEKKVPNAQSPTKPKFIQATPGCKESYNQNSVRVDGKTLHSSSSQHGCASVCKPQDCKSIESKSNHKIEIKKKTKTEPSKSIKEQKKKYIGNVRYDSMDQKKTESTSSDRQTCEKKLLYLIKNRKTVTDVGKKMKFDVHKSHHENITSDTPKKLLISYEHKSHHEGSTSETNNNCKSKHSPQHSNKSRSHRQKSASQKIIKSSSHSSRRSQDSNSSRREGENHKTNSKDTISQSYTNILEETQCRSTDREESQVLSKEEMDYKSSDIVKKRVLSNVYKKEVDLTSSGTTKKRSHVTSHHTKLVHRSNKTKKAVESLKKPSNNTVEKSFPKESSEATADTVPAAYPHYHYYYCDTNGGPYCCKLSAETSSKILKNTENAFFSLALAEDDKQKSTTGDQVQVNHSILVSTEPCSILGDNQALSDTCTSEIPFKGSNNQNKKRPLDPQSQGLQEQNKIQKINNVESAEHQPMLSNPLLDDDVSPGEMSDLSRGCIPHSQLSIEQSATANSLSNHHLLTGIMPSLDAAMDLSQKSSEVSCDRSLCIPKQEKVSDVTNNKADVQNTNEISIPTSGTVGTSVHMEKQNPVKQEVITECKQEDKNWFRTCIGSYSACSNGSVMKQSEIIIIDDDDDDDCYIFEKTTSCTVSVTKKNKQNITVEPLITVEPVVSMFDNDKSEYEDSIEAIVQQNGLSLFPSEDVSLEGVISVDKCDGNEYIFIEKPNFEIPNMEQPITEKKTAPFKIKNVMNYFRSSLKQPNHVQIEDDKIKVSANYKIFIGCLVFLHVNYNYFFQTICDDIKRLAEILHLHLNARILCAQMEINALKLEEGEFKKKATENAEEFIKTNISTHSLQFSHLFVQIIQKFKDSKPLSPFYQTLFSLILFQRIIHYLHCIDRENVNKHFFAIRFLVRDLLSFAESHVNVMSLLTEKSKSNFVNDFNIITRSIRIIQLALTCHYCGRISNRNQQHSNIVIYQNETSSSSLIRINRKDNDIQAPAFTQSPSVSSTQLHVNNTVQSPLMPDSSTLCNNNMTNDSIQPYPDSVSEVTNKSPVSLHPVQGVVLPRTNVTANNQNENQHLNIQKQSTVDYGNYSFPGSRETMANLHYVPVNERALGSQNPAWNSTQTNNNNLKQRRHNGSHELGRPPINYSSIQAFRPPVTAHNGLIYLPGNEVVAVGSQNSTWNNRQRRLNESGLPLDASSSSSQAYRSPIDHNGLHYMSDTETVAVGSQNPAWNINTQNVNNNLQRRFSDHVTGGPHNEYGLMSNHQRRRSNPSETVSGLISNQHISRQYRPDPVTHNGLNSMSEIRNVGNNPNNSMYMNMQPRAEITPDSNFHIAEQQHKSTLLPNMTAPNSFTTASKNNSLVHSSFLPRSSSSAFHPPNTEYTNVPQRNHSVYSRVQGVANNTNDNYNVHSSGSGTNCQQDSSLEQRVQRIEPTQLPPMVQAPPPLFYQNTTMMMYRRDMLLPQPQNDNA